MVASGDRCVGVMRERLTNSTLEQGRESEEDDTHADRLISRPVPAWNGFARAAQQRDRCPLTQPRGNASRKDILSTNSSKSHDGTVLCRGS